MSNTQKFSGRAEAYAKARPAYADAAIDYLNDIGMGDGKVVADVGAGTGIFSKQILNLGAEVYAVEPNDEMRMFAEKDLKNYPLFHAVAAPAEDIPLPDKSLDFITAAQAFHWFDKDLFKKECARLLKPQGKVILIWNNTLSQNALFKEYDVILRKYRPNLNKQGSDEVDEEVALFMKNRGKKVFAHPLFYEKERFINQFLSTSAALKVGDENYDAYVRELSGLFERYQVDGRVLWPNQTVLFVGDVSFS